MERAIPAKSWKERWDRFQEVSSFEAITDKFVTKVLTDTGYRFLKDGVAVVMKAKEIATAPTFKWRTYIEEAEKSYEADFPDDEFLSIRGVGFKTRDLALSILCDRFVAMDVHVVRVISRTGLLLHGYGIADISTDVSKESGYMFFHALVLKLARQTGWPTSTSGYSPGEIDRMIWNFGRAMCGDKPKCKLCPLAGVCLTSGRSFG